MRTTQAQKIFNAGVWQDKDAPGRVRIASSQPVMVGDTPRTPPQNTKSTRVQNHSTRQKLRQVASWVDEPIIAQLQELARSQGLSISQTIRDLLKEILRQRFHQQQAATLPSIIEQAVAKSHRSLATRLSWLLVRIAFDAGQTRVLATNTLGMQDGMTEESLKEILATADKRTKANLTRKTPQLTELMEAIEKWLLEGEKEVKKN
ncbi:MAG: ribbon-helix-helix protein, CopG family [Thermoproteota archaeon]|nr:ribbon-helix-helix protein, CopG family [Thermoproteota archaeon]